jgi:hypothetical protein
MASTPFLDVPIDQLRRTVTPFVMMERMRALGGQSRPLGFVVNAGRLEVVSADADLRVAIRGVRTDDPAMHGRAVTVDVEALGRLLVDLPGTIDDAPTGTRATVRFVEEGSTWRAEVDDGAQVTPALTAVLAGMREEPAAAWPLLLAWTIRARELGRDAIDDDEALSQVLEALTNQLNHREYDVLVPLVRTWVERVGRWLDSMPIEERAVYQLGAVARLSEIGDVAYEWDRVRALEVLSRTPDMPVSMALRDRAVISVIARAQHGTDVTTERLPSEERRALALELDVLLGHALRDGTQWSIADLTVLTPDITAPSRAQVDELAAGRLREIDSTYTTRLSSMSLDVLRAAVLHYAPDDRQWTARLSADDVATATAIARSWPVDAAPLSDDVMTQVRRVLEQREKVLDSDDKVSTLRRASEAKRQESRLQGRSSRPTEFLVRPDGTSPLDTGPAPLRTLTVTPLDAPLPIAFTPSTVPVGLPLDVLLLHAVSAGAPVLVEPLTSSWIVPTRDAIVLWAQDAGDVAHAPISAAEWRARPDAALTPGVPMWYALDAAEAVALRAIWNERAVSYKSVGGRRAGSVSVDVYDADGDRILSIAGDAQLRLSAARIDRAREVLTPALCAQFRAAAAALASSERVQKPAVTVDSAMVGRLVTWNTQRQVVEDAEVLEGLRPNTDITTFAVSAPQLPGYVGVGRERRRVPEGLVLHGAPADAAGATVLLVEPDVMTESLRLAMYHDGPQQAVRVHAISSETGSHVLVRRDNLGVVIAEPARDAAWRPSVSEPERAVWRSLGFPDVGAS